MNFFAKSYKIPMFAYRPGDSISDHTKNEHIRITEYPESIEVYAKAFQRLAALGQRSPLVRPAIQ